MPSDTPQASVASLPSATGIHALPCEERTVAKGPSNSGVTRAGEAPRKRRSAAEETKPERTPDLDPNPEPESTPPKQHPQPHHHLSEPSCAFLSGVAGILVQKHLAKRKREIIKRYMEIVSQWLEPRAAALDRSGENDSGGVGKRSGRAAGAGRTSMKKVIGQKRQLSDDERENEPASHNLKDEDSKTEHQSTRTIKRSRIDDNTSPRLACPYFQRDPARFANALTCRGHSWPTISRLKEHLHRTHQRPQYQCKRCRSLFVEEGELEEHQTQETACKLDKRATVKVDTLDGYDADQAERLKKRLVGKSVEEKWREMYSILFCLDSKTAMIPSPYYSAIVPPETLSVKTGASERLRQLVPVIQNTIAHHLDRELSALLSSRQTICAITTRINDEVNSVIRTFGEITPAPTMASTAVATSDTLLDMAAPDTAPHAHHLEEPSTAEMLGYFDIEGLMAQISASTGGWLLGDLGSAAGVGLDGLGGILEGHEPSSLGGIVDVGDGEWGLAAAETVPTDGSDVSDVFSAAGGSLGSADTRSATDLAARHSSPAEGKPEGR